MGEALLSFEQVSKVYGSGAAREKVLCEVCFSIEPQETVALIGDRLGGKTTLMRLAAGIDSPSYGVVRFDGLDIGGLGDAQRAQLIGSERIAWCDRAGPVMGLSVLDWVSMPLVVGPIRQRRKAAGRAREALARLGASSCGDQRWSELSPWQRVLVCLARAAVCKPRLLLADDLLDGLGTMRTQEGGALLHALATETGCAVLMTVSDEETASVTDRVLSLHAGQLREIGAAPQSQRERGKLIVFPGRAKAAGSA